jgi:hypothetical protein
MALTVAALEAEIITRIGGKWGQAQLSVLTNGSNPDLKSPIRRGLRYVGLTPADPITPVDADLAAVPATSAEVYMDAATLEALYVCQGRFQQGFDQKVQDQQQWLHQIMTDLAAMIADYQSRVPKLNLGKTSVGHLEHGEHIPRDRPGNLWGGLYGGYWGGW